MIAAIKAFEQIAEINRLRIPVKVHRRSYFFVISKYVDKQASRSQGQCEQLDSQSYVQQEGCRVTKLTQRENDARF